MSIRGKVLIGILGATALLNLVAILIMWLEMVTIWIELIPFAVIILCAICAMIINEEEC